MNVLLIHQAFASPNEPGGTRHYELARHMAESGHRFTIVTSDLSYLTGNKISGSKKLIETEMLDGIRLLRAYTYPSLHRSFVWRIFSFVSFMVTSVLAALRNGSVDVVMGTSPPIFQAVSAWIVSCIQRKPFLLEIRDLWPEFAIDMGVLTHPVLIAVSRWLERFLYRMADHILVNSPAYREYLINKGIQKEKISLISNGVDVKMFDPTERGGVLRRQWRVENKFVVTYAGALGLANDIPTILRAAERLKDQQNIHFLLVGDGKEKTNLERMADRMELSNVTFTGSKSKSLMPEVLAASDACLATLQNIPMFGTTYPNKVFDYMAAGRPTVLGIDGVIRDVIEAADGGMFVPPGNDRLLADAVMMLAENPEKARKMGQCAREYVAAHFDRNEQAEVFRQLLIRLK